MSSIIEKALEKLDRTEPEPLSQDPPLAPEAEADDLDVPPTVRRARAEPMEATPSPAAPEQPARDSGKRTVREVRLDLDRLAAAGVLTPRSGDSALAEEFRHLKRPILMKCAASADTDEHANLIMVTSSLPGEGKTFTAVNLAVSIAMELDRTVLLVDSDVSKSDVTRLLGIDAVEGLTDYLVSNTLELADVLVKTDVPKLTVLPAGRQHPNLTELLTSEDMGRLTAELATRYPDRIVVFDSPPLLATTGATALAHLVGQILVVVEAERTLQAQVKEALKLLEGLENVTLVLNKSRLKRRAKYGYGYGYHGGH